MTQKPNINTMSGTIDLTCAGDYLLCGCGKTLEVFRKDGEHLFSGGKIRWPHEFLLLRPDLLFVEAGGWYYLLEMPEGKIIWSAQGPKGYNNWLNLRLSPDGKKIYQRSDAIRTNETRITIIDLVTGTVTQTPAIWCGLRCIDDFILDEAENLCFLQSQIDDTDTGGTVTTVGVAYLEGWKEAPRPLRNQEKTTRTMPSRFGRDSRTMVTRGYLVYHFWDESYADLIANTPNHPPFGEYCNLLMKASGCDRYLFDLRQTGTVLVDLEQERIVGQFANLSNLGSVVGDEFWCFAGAGGKGLVRRKFPCLDPLPPERLITFHV